MHTHKHENKRTNNKYVAGCVCFSGFGIFCFYVFFNFLIFGFVRSFVIHDKRQFHLETKTKTKTKVSGTLDDGRRTVSEKFLGCRGCGLIFTQVQ